MPRPDLEEIKLLHERLCAAVSDPTRIALLFELGDGPRNVTTLVEALGAPQGTVSRHLRVLYDRGLVTSEREANRVVYRLRDRRVIHALDLMRSILADQLHKQTETAQRIGIARRSSATGKKKTGKGSAAARSGRKA